MADNNKEGTAEHINVKVQGQDGAVIHFKIKKNTALRKLMNAYCDRLGLKTSTVRFIFDGVNIKETDTPTSLDMEENDTIEVFQSQTGGLVPDVFEDYEYTSEEDAWDIPSEDQSITSELEGFESQSEDEQVREESIDRSPNASLKRRADIMGSYESPKEKKTRNVSMPELKEPPREFYIDIMQIPKQLRGFRKDGHKFKLTHLVYKSVETGETVIGRPIKF